MKSHHPRSVGNPNAASTLRSMGVQCPIWVGATLLVHWFPIKGWFSIGFPLVFHWFPMKQPGLEDFVAHWFGEPYGAPVVPRPDILCGGVHG